MRKHQKIHELKSLNTDLEQNPSKNSTDIINISKLKVHFSKLQKIYETDQKKSFRSALAKSLQERISKKYWEHKMENISSFLDLRASLSIFCGHGTWFRWELMWYIPTKTTMIIMSFFYFNLVQINKIILNLHNFKIIFISITANSIFI